MSGPRRAWLRTMHRRHIRRVILGAGGSGFSPANVAGLTLWLDANVGLFQTTAAGTASGDTDPVGTWVDQSPSGNRASQGTGADKPSLQLDAGHASGVGPYVLFDGLNDTLAVFDTLTAGTVFAVIFHSGPVAQERVIDADDTGGWSIQLNNVTQHYEVVGITVASDFRVNGALSVVAQVPALATTRVLTAKVTTPALLAVALASKATALGTDPFHGGLREILVYTGRLADSDRVAIENYLFLKWMPVAAGFTGTTSGFAGGTFSFIDASEYAVSWSWEKNDGSGWVPFAGTPTAQSPNEVLAAGTWSIRQTVTGHGGDVNTLTRTNYVVVSVASPLTGFYAWFSGLNGTPTGAVTTVTPDVGARSLTASAAGLTYQTAKVAQGVHFDGTNYLEGAHSAELSPGDNSWTATLWVQGEDYGAEYYIVSKGAGGTLEYSLRFNVTSGRFAFAVYTGAGASVGSVECTSLGTLAVGAWYLLELVYDKPGNRIGIAGNNGAFEYLTLSGSPGAATDPFRLGTIFAGVEPWKGMIDAFGLGMGLMDATQRNALWNSGAGGEDY